MASSRPNGQAEVHRDWIERFILKLADKYHIRVQWDKTTLLLTGVCAVAGAIVGGYTGGKISAVIGAGAGGAAGFAMASIREIWPRIQKKVKELWYIVLNFLRRIDPDNLIRAAKFVMAHVNIENELVQLIVDFLIDKLGRLVVSKILY